MGHDNTRPERTIAPEAQPRLNQPQCKTNYIRPYLYPTVWETLKSLFTTEGYALTGIQYVMEGYFFSCAECQRVCPAGKLKQKLESK